MATTGKKKTSTVETAETKLPKVLDIPTAVNALMAEAAGKSLSVNNITMSIDGLEAYVNETLPNYAPDKYTGDADAAKKDRAVLNGGLKVIPINVADRAVNGYYRDGNIYVNTNRGAEWTMRWVAGHEMLHDVAKKSPDAYDAYKQAVLNMW